MLQSTSQPTDNPTPAATPAPSASAYFAAEVQRYKAMNSTEVCNALFCAWVRSSLKLEGTDLEILQSMTPYLFIWQAAWKAKS